ncbi:carotenoid biosynthesis protein [Marinilabilia salmonicolor]|uniref:carotenoid biosynthesis protein n=1 Tax=Marinilabilia salmonicolor TaxID=989 RepID=UPI00029AE37D|nr:carotenoid biosynthesis protein [Marinilabilia salmonicolor]
MTEKLRQLTRKHLTPERINRFWLIYYTVGVIGFAQPVSRELFQNLTGLSILMSTAIMLYFHRPWNVAFIGALTFVLLGGIFIEAVGVNTGIVFGEYQYGATLGPKIAGTPLLIGINWVMLIYIVWQIVQKINIRGAGQLLIGATLLVGYDLFLEPIAMSTDMWNWAGQQVPHQNYIAWFIISLVFLSIFKMAKINYQNPVAPGLLAAQAGFFFLLNLLNI